MTISKSPQRHTFQKENYVNCLAKEGKEPDPAYLAHLDLLLDQENSKFNDPKSRINNLEWDLRTTNWILEKVRSSEVYAQNLYAAMCNNSFIKHEMWTLLKEETWVCSWRYAGGIVAHMRQEGDYIDWYCSGIRDTSLPTEEEWNSWTLEQQNSYTNKYGNYVREGVVTDEVETDLYQLGWIIVKDNINNGT